MSGDRTVGVGLTLRDNGFSSGLSGLLQRTKTTGSAMGRSLESSLASGVSRGAGAAAGHLRGAFDKVTNFAGGIGGLGAAMGVTALINDAVKADAKFRGLATTLNWAGKGAFTFGQLQQRAAQATNQWGIASEDLADGVRAIFADTGDADAAVGAMSHVAMISRATGMSVQDVSGLVGGLNEQFGVTNDKLDDTVAGLLELSSKGGVSIQDISAGMGDMARAAKLAGVEGPEGLKQIVALSNQLEGAAGGGAQAIQLMTGTLSRLAANPALQKELKQKFGIDAKGKGAVNVLGEILAKNKGHEVEALGQLFKSGDAVKLAQGLGGGGFSAALSSAQTTKGGADLQAIAAEQMKSPEAQLELALQKLRAAFTQPKVIDSLTKLATILPPVIEGFTKLVGFLAEHQSALAAVGIAGALGKFAAALGTTTTAAGKAAEVLGGLKGGGGGAGNLGPAAALAALSIGEAYDQGVKLKQELEGGVPGQSGQEADIAMNAARLAVADNRGGSTKFTDEFGNEHALAPYFDPDTGEISYSDLSQVGGAEPMYTNDPKLNGTLKSEILGDSMRATIDAQTARDEYTKRRGGMARGGAVLGEALGQQDWFQSAMGSLPFMGGGGGSRTGGQNAGPAEVKTPELVGLLRGGIVVSLNPASAEAIGAAVAGKVGMPTIKTGVDDHG